MNNRISFEVRLLYQIVRFLRFLSLVPYIYPPCQRPRTNQRWTKDEPKNSKTQKSTFVKFAVSFISLVPCLIPPRELRENSEGTPTRLPAFKKCYLLRLRPNKVVLIPKKLYPFLKKSTHFLKPLTYIPRLYTLHFTPYTRKIALKCDFFC